MRTIAQETRNRFSDYMRIQKEPVPLGRIKRATKIHWRIVKKLLAERIEKKEAIELTIGSKKYYEMVPSCYGQYSMVIITIKDGSSKCSACRFGKACQEKNPSFVAPA